MSTIIGFTKTKKQALSLIFSNSNTDQSFFYEKLDNGFVVKCNISHTEEFQNELNNIFK